MATINPLTGLPYNWTDQGNYGDVNAYINDPRWSTYGQLASGDEPAFDPVWTQQTNEAVKAIAQPGMTFGLQDDGRMQSLVVQDPVGEVAYRTEPTYHTPDNFWKEAVLPMAAFAIGAPLLGSAAGIPIPVGTPTLGGLFGAGELANTAPSLAEGSGAWLGEGVASGVPAWDAAALGAEGAAATLPASALTANEQLLQSGVDEIIGASGGWDAVTGAAAGGAAGGLLGSAGSSALSFLKDNKWALPLLSAGLSAAGGSSGGGGYADSGYRPTIKRGGFSPSAKPIYLQPQQAGGLLSLPTTGNENSGLWRYGLLGG